MPQPQIDNTAVKRPLHPEDYPDLIGPPRPRQMDTGFYSTDYANPIQRAVQKYSSAYLNSSFANSPFMDVMRWVPGLHVVEKILTGQPVSEEEQMSMMMPVKMKALEIPKINYTGFTPREDFTISATPVATRSTGRTNYSLLERPSRISTAERAGVPKGDRNQKVVATTWRQGDDAVKMFRDYGGIEAQEGSPLMEQIKLYVPEARERYGLVGNTNISDTEIAQSLYKRALQLSGTNNGAVYASGEPIILFRGDTRRFHTLAPRMSPDELATKRGTMDNALGNLFLGEYPNNWVGNDRYMGTIRNFGGEFSWEGSGTGSKIRSEFSSLNPMEYVVQKKPRILYSGTVGRIQRPIAVYKAPASAMESGVNDLNAFIVKSPAVRDATPEISVLNDDLLTKGFKGTTPHMRTKLIEDETGFLMFLHPDGSTSPALAGYDNRIGMAEHYNYVLNDAKNKGQGLLMSRPGAVLRDEHSGYTYYALPNFNIRNAKHLLGYDLMQPIEKSWAIYRKQGGRL